MTRSAPRASTSRPSEARAFDLSTSHNSRAAAHRTALDTKRPQGRPLALVYSSIVRWQNILSVHISTEAAPSLLRSPPSDLRCPHTSASSLFPAIALASEQPPASSAQRSHVTELRRRTPLRENDARTLAPGSGGAAQSQLARRPGQRSQAAQELYRGARPEEGACGPQRHNTRASARAAGERQNSGQATAAPPQWRGGRSFHLNACCRRRRELDAGR